jgi:hypothetical protein
MRPMFLLLALVLLGAALPAQSQSAAEWNPQGLKMERTELEELLRRFEDVAASTGYSQRLRDRAQRDAGIIRERLERGDFRVGDRVILRVEGEPDLPESLPVEPGPRISIPVMGSISLESVLRSELEEHLTRELGRFIQSPVVHAQSEVRISILGSVGSPGFYTVPADMLVGEVLMHAGGPGSNADLDNLRIERMGQALWRGDEMGEVLAEGMTLDQLNVRAGDQIVLPVRPTTTWRSRAVRWSLAIATTVLFGVRVLF